MDEKRHHEILNKILEILVKGETITEEEWFNVVWKSAPFHGFPGGDISARLREVDAKWEVRVNYLRSNFQVV